MGIFPTESKMNQQPHPRKKINPTDLILFVAAIFLLFYIPWNNMNSFYRLILFLYFLCVMLRITNIRKVKMREMEMARRKAEKEQAAQNALSAPAEPAETISHTESEKTTEVLETEQKPSEE